MHQEKYSLTWPSYSDHLRGMMKELMINEDLSDVTLVTEDKKKIQANMNILSTCSPVFKDILKKDKHSNQIMYLRGVQYSDLASIMQFIYLGEVTFYEERIDEFFAVAKSLEIKELCNDENKTINELVDELYSSDPEASTEKFEEQTVISDDIKKEAPQEKHRKSVVNMNGKYFCGQCQKILKSQQSLNVHIQSKHKGVKYACDHCDHQASSQSNLISHIQSKHEGVRYACDQCAYQARYQGDLTRHVQSKHQGVKYACDQCDYQATTKFNLISHIQSKHKSVKYGCDQCDALFTDQSTLRRHVRSKHQGVKYACDQCDFQFKRKDILSAHIQSKYACDQCSFKICRKSILTSHKSKVHGPHPLETNKKSTPHNL